MKYKEIINKMTIEEKASLMSGENFWNTKAIKRLDIPGIMLTDGPHGLRKQGGKEDHLGLNKSLPATCFPTAATLANSWDSDLAYEVGKSIGNEAASEKVSVLLGPGLNIKRNPLGGRNFEYFSEDPYLTGKLASEMVNGIQSNDISACPKHFAVNSQEHMRMTIDEIVDERSLREIYLEGFRIVVENGNPKTIMTSYNRVNGTFANENIHLLQDILYAEWKYNGVLVTDWGANNNRVEGLKAGNQLEMPSTNGITDREIIQAINDNVLSEDILDLAVDQLLDLIYSTGFQDSKTPAVDYDKNHKRAIEAAKRSIVLLKNKDNTLPLKAQDRIAIIGDFAKNPRYQGAGSSLVNPTKLSNAWDSLSDLNLNIIGYSQGFNRLGGNNNSLFKEAVSLGVNADVILLFLGLDESIEAEGVDRKNLSLPDNQLELVSELVKMNCNIVIIISGGGAIEMPFVHNVNAILHTYLSGQGGGEAIASILAGKYNPSGKLSETFPVAYEDIPSSAYYPGLEKTAEHREGLFVGYRYFNTFNIPVLFPFGFGMSYTNFEYSDIKLKGNRVCFTITNTGSFLGEEIAQLYIEKVNSSIFRAKRELKGFKKVFLAVGASKEICINFEKNCFSYFNITINDWVIEPGDYEIQIGSSIESIHLSKTITSKGDPIASEHTKQEFPNYYNGNIHNIPDKEYYNLLGYNPPSPNWNLDEDLDLNDTFAQTKYKNMFGRAIYNMIFGFNKFFTLIKKPLLANSVYFILNMPFRNIDRFTGGKISRKKVSKLLKWINK